MKKNNLLIFGILLLIVFPLITAEESFTFKQNTKFNLEISMSNANLSTCFNCACNISLFYPNGSTLVKNSAGVTSDGYCKYNSSSSVLGIHGGEMYFTDGVSSGRSSFEFEITPSGFVNNPTFSFLILILSIGFIILGLWKEDVPITMLGDFGLYFFGIYTLFYGINGVKDTTITWATGIIVLGVAFYISIRAGMEYLNELN